MSALNEMLDWSTDELGKAQAEGKSGRAARLAALHDKLIQTKDRSSAIYPPGSTQRLLAENRERRLLAQGAALGFAPEGQQVIGELAQHAAGLEIVPGG